MSYRVVFEPAHFGDTPGDTKGADIVIHEGATNDEVDDAATLISWALPLRIWAPSRDDPRLLRFLETLSEEHHQEVYENQIEVKP